MKMKLVLFSLIMLTLTHTVTAQMVKEGAESLVCRQPDGKEIVVPKCPKRVVIAYGSLAKVWDLAGGTAVGVPTPSETDILPESMRDLPKIGRSAGTPNMEVIMSLNPDFVLLNAKMERHVAAAEIFRSAGINALCVEYGNYSNFHKLLDLFCRINGEDINENPAAKKIIEYVENICRQTKNLESPRCAVIFAAATGFSLETTQSNTGMMAAMLNAENILKAQGSSRVNFSYEQLLIDDPDVIFVSTMGDAEVLQKKFEKEFTSQPAWKELKAAKANRVHFLPKEYFLYVPGPDYPQGFLYLAKLLYPEENFEEFEE